MTPSEASFGGIMQHAHARKFAVLARTLAVAAIACIGASAGAQETNVPAPLVRPGPPRAVIELFTSQGCADCPAADALLNDFIENENIVGLTLPVDYWDYLGWNDTLAVPRNSDRQRAYAQSLGTGTVYTPQAIVNGAAEVLGSSRSEIERAISATDTALSSSRVPVHFWAYRGSIIIETGPAPRDTEPSKESTIWLAVVQRSVTVTVKGGENKGKSLTYYNVVRELTPVGLWNGKPATIRLARAEIMRPEEDLIVLIQEPDYGPIIGAARLGD
jgi:hypothetical protein